MKIEEFEDILAWQKSRELALNIYRIFRDGKDFGFRSQIKRKDIFWIDKNLTNIIIF
jgi:hypothetical protein